jgi:ADP-L-glycero-D-manno-heptose 6-epimerase
MIVLTGGAGFIGSCFLKTLNDEGVYDAVVVDTLGTGLKWKNLVGKRFSAIVSPQRFREQCLNDTLDGAIEAIVHLGACSATTERDADFLLDNNTQYSIDLATAASKNSIRLIYASSAATYGMGEQGYADWLGATLRPLNMYGYSKLLFDQWVRETGLDGEFTGIRYFNVFGPNEYHKGDMASMMYKAFGQISRTGSLRLFRSNSPDFPDGGQMRDFIYVKDVCRVMWKLLENKDIRGIYNLGAGCARTWNDLATAVFTAMGRTPDIEYIDMPESLAGQYQNYTCADMTALNETGAATTFTTLEDGIHDYVTNYLATENKYL